MRENPLAFFERDFSERIWDFKPGCDLVFPISCKVNCLCKLIPRNIKLKEYLPDKQDLSKNEYTLYLFFFLKNEYSVGNKSI